jgi:hypothetical protein
LMLTGMCPWLLPSFTSVYKCLQHPNHSGFTLTPASCASECDQGQGARQYLLRSCLTLQPPRRTACTLSIFDACPIDNFWLVVYLHIPTPLKNMSQLRLWNSQYMEK